MNCNPAGLHVPTTARSVAPSIGTPATPTVPRRIGLSVVTGTVVAGSDVRIDHVVVSQGDLKVTVTSETSVGAHELLRDGAILCRGAEDVLAELFPSVGPRAGLVAARSKPSTELSSEAARLYHALRREESLSAEELAQSLDLPAATVLAGLFELEGAGLAVCDAGRYGVVRR